MADVIQYAPGKRPESETCESAWFAELPDWRNPVAGISTVKAMTWWHVNEHIGGKGTMNIGTRIVELLSMNPDGLSNSEIINHLQSPTSSVSARLAEMTRRGQIERVKHGVYRLPKPTTARPRELVEAWISQKEIPGYMRNQPPRKVTMYSITRLANVLQMKLRNGAKHITVPLIGESIRIHIGNDVPSWPYSETVTGYTEIEFLFSTGETSTISVSSTDVITVALET